MSICFVVGRAGSGKTWRCLEAIRARLRESAFVGNRLLLLVPEQASFQMERALIETPDIPGYTRCEVLSFQRLAHRIFAETGADPRGSDQTIGPLGRLMVLRRIVRTQRPALRLLGRVADRPGLVRQLSRTIDELMREDVEPATLAQLAERSAAGDPLQSARLADVTRIYQAYRDYLVDDRLDPAQYLRLAADRLDRCAWLVGAEVWVDGFAGFTQQEYHLLTQLASRVARVEVTLLVEPDASAIDSARPPRESLSLFARTERTLVLLREAMAGAGVSDEAPVRLGTAPPPRFRSPDLVQLERHVFRSSPPGKTAQPAGGAIHIVEMADRRSEVQGAIAEIQRLTREATPPMRYRDMAVVVRDLTAYHDLLAAAMRSNGIPCFIDRRQPTTHHPLIELTRALLAIADDDCRLESVRLTLKTGLLPLEPTEADLLENYILASGISGRRAFGEPWRDTRMFQPLGRDNALSPMQEALLRRVNAARHKWNTVLGPWLSATADRAVAPGRQWAEALYACLEALEVPTRLDDWAGSAEANGRQDEADMHRQVWQDFTVLLDEFVRSLGTEEMGIEEFRETVEAGLAEFNLGLAPPTLDQVLVGAIERSRHPSVRAVLLLGFDESHFPMRRSEDPLLGDDERDTLEAAGVRVGTSRRRQLLDERMLAYIALTRAGERLWISYPRSAEDGRPIHPSPYLDDVLRAVPGLAIERSGDPQSERSPVALTRVGELGGRLAREFRYRGLATDDSRPDVRGVWNSLYELARRRGEWQQTLRRCLAGLSYENTAEIADRLLEEPSDEPFRASVSRLERFASCPFSHFAEYTLGLRPRVEAELNAMDLGTLSHAVLERLVGELVENKRSLGDMEDDEIRERIDAIAAQALPEIAGELMLSEARNRYSFDASRAHLARVTRWQRDAARAGRFRQLRVELPFGFSGEPIAPLTLKTPAGRTILLRGRIDRIDIAELGSELVGTVIDYKRTSDRRLDLCAVYHGLALQLVGYLLVLEQLGESLTGRPIRPVGAFYLPLLEGYTTVSHPREEKGGGYCWRGIADASALRVLDEKLAPGCSSEYYSITMKKDGAPAVRSEVGSTNELAALMRHVGLRMGQLADRLLDGEITIRPYRLRRQTPCGFCTYRAICRYEIETQAPNTLPVLKRADVLRVVMEEPKDG